MPDGFASRIAAKINLRIALWAEHGAHAVADDQHSYHQFRIDRGANRAAVGRLQLCVDALKIQVAVDPAKQMVVRSRAGAAPEPPEFPSFA
uniref:Uncharacterized protein n=1 Tax=Rhizobium laguerreae TaxID=1076926 RepID=A0A6N9ZQ97_9HYPH|nr:hypothetical protein [Rhizobium laguerreae]